MEERKYCSTNYIDMGDVYPKQTGKYGNSRSRFYEANINERRAVLTEEEREYIKNIIAPFRNKVTGIRKLKQSTEYQMQILYNQRYVSINGGMWGYDAIWLPPFPITSKAYENLEEDKIYLLDFLCL